MQKEAGGKQWEAKAEEIAYRIKDELDRLAGRHKLNYIQVQIEITPLGYGPSVSGSYYVKNREEAVSLVEKAIQRVLPQGTLSGNTRPKYSIRPIQSSSKPKPLHAGI